MVSSFDLFRSSLFFERGELPFNSVDVFYSTMNVYLLIYVKGRFE